ncbi:TolC family protein [Flagellatimonas centrodinii]|uniref:TolC family protein n=1 Tax=Flagellatimonas centrodinii TaxID=2806210 RepID=UPI001FEF9B0A|nr:TolC family protein [Flagellatimonas centrodinii]ULQ45276.1 TolC family protein [Flagellatimonas centrodinii]
MMDLTSRRIVRLSHRDALNCLLPLALALWVAGCAATPDSPPQTVLPMGDEMPATVSADDALPVAAPPANASSSGAPDQASQQQSAPLDLSLPRAERELARLPQAPDMGDRPAALDLGDALGIVWQRHPRVQQSERALEATNFDISGAQAGYYPYLALQTEQRDDGENTSIVRVVQPLWNGGLTGAQVEISRSQQLAALAELNRVRLELGVNTAEAYLSLAATSELDQQWRSYIGALEGLLELIRRRASQGVSPQSDEQTVMTRLSQARASAQANRALLVSARTQLASLIDLAPERVEWPDQRRLLSDAELRAVGRVNIEAHPLRQAAQAAIRQQQATTRASKAGLWPQLAFEYRRQVDGFVVDPNNDDAALLVMQYQSNNGLQGYRAYQADLARTASAEAALTAAIRDVNSAIEVARAERASALMQIDAQVAAAESAQALVDSFRRQFEVGRKSWLEVLNAQREANDAVLQAISVRRSLWSANARLALQGLFWRRLSEQAPAINVIQED